MNKYEVKISGQPRPIQVRASSAAIAMRRALNTLTDSNFLNTVITIKYRGRADGAFPRVIVRAHDPLENQLDALAQIEGEQ
jgi:hypothetical protein